MSKFKGFPPGDPNVLKIHAQFVSDVMPLIDSLAEMKVVLFTYQALHQKSGRTRYLQRAEYNSALLKRDETFSDPGSLQDGLDRAVRHGILLQADVQLDSGTQTLYFLNTNRGRFAVQQVQAGRWEPGYERPIEILPDRPDIYTLYEENIGPLTPLIADELDDADETYSPEWIADAIQLAVENNARSWKYILAILKRWKQEGRTNETTGRTDASDSQFAGWEWSDFSE
jgi:DnaD/phage-associated family protein